MQMSPDPNQLPVPDLGLVCLRCRYPLVGATAHRCPECGEAFTLDGMIPPGDWPEVYRLGKRVRLTNRVADALHQAEIPVQRDDVMASIFGGFSIGRGYLRVPRTFYYDALAALAALDLDRAGDSSLRTEDSEPVGGDAGGADDSQIEWQCHQCGEMNPGNFEICFNCSTDRQGDEPPAPSGDGI